MIRSPDLREKIALIKKHESVLKPRLRYIRKLYDQVYEPMSSVIQQYCDPILPDESARLKFISDWKDGVVTALVCAWCSGREFGEKYKEHDYYLFVIENNDLNSLPEATQNELKDFEDFGAETLLRTIQDSYRMHTIDDVTALNCFELIHQIHRDGVFFAFRDGVLSFASVND